MADIKKLKQMMDEPASKEWFAKHGLPKAIKDHPMKQNVAKKMPKKIEYLSKMGLEAMERAYAARGKQVPVRYYGSRLKQ